MRTILVILFIMFMLPFCALGKEHCGKELWSKKVGDDIDSSRVDTVPVIRPMAYLASFPMKSKEELDSHSNTRWPEELHTYMMYADIIKIKKEQDGDMHIVIQQNADTMIAEIPRPDCVSNHSPFKTKITNVRKILTELYKRVQYDSSKPIRVHVKISGVFFFDFKHSQKGASPNYGELHPITGLEIL